MKNTTEAAGWDVTTTYQSIIKSTEAPLSIRRTNVATHAKHLVYCEKAHDVTRLLTSMK